MKTGYTVMDLMTTNPIKAQEDFPVNKIAKLMKEKGVGSVLIMKDDKLAGILTEKDIVLKVTAENLKAAETPAKDIMTPAKELIAIEAEKDVYDAINVMKENEIRRLPVMSDGKLKGLITLKDILKIEPTLFDLIVEKIRIKEEDRKLNVSQEEESFEDEE